ncbi:MAG: hypothetical protein JWQ74_3524 [Marmoricola sp.]|nr:hypothetical protein [Marmoricola sp.]
MTPNRKESVTNRQGIEHERSTYEAETWLRFSEETPEGGQIVLVRYPEGYRLRYHGETVWTQPG